MSEAPDPADRPGTPGRYARSANGLVAAMIVTVLAVAGFALLKGLVSNDLVVEPESLPYLERVEQAQDAGIEVVYPPELPEGWIATRVQVEPGDPPSFGLNLLTADEQFVGLRQDPASVEDLLDQYVDESPDEGEPYETTGSVATTWRTFDDDGGDVAYAAEVGGTTVLVYGSTGREDLEKVIASLTTAPSPQDRPTARS